MRAKRLMIGILLGLVALLLFAAIIHFRCPAKTGIDTNLATYKKLRLGMAESEVEAIIGGRAGRYTSEHYLGSIGNAHSPYQAGDYEKQWETDEGTIIVRFDTEKGAVVLDRRQGFVRESVSDKIKRLIRSVLTSSSDPDARYRLP